MVVAGLHVQQREVSAGAERTRLRVHWKRSLMEMGSNRTAVNVGAEKIVWFRGRTCVELAGVVWVCPTVRATLLRIRQRNEKLKRVSAETASPQHGLAARATRRVFRNREETYGACVEGRVHVREATVFSGSPVQRIAVKEVGCTADVTKQAVGDELRPTF